MARKIPVYPDPSTPPILGGVVGGSTAPAADAPGLARARAARTRARERQAARRQERLARRAHAPEAPGRGAAGGRGA